MEQNLFFLLLCYSVHLYRHINVCFRNLTFDELHAENGNAISKTNAYAMKERQKKNNNRFAQVGCECIMIRIDNNDVSHFDALAHKNANGFVHCSFFRSSIHSLFQISRISLMCVCDHLRKKSNNNVQLCKVRVASTMTIVKRKEHKKIIIKQTLNIFKSRTFYCLLLVCVWLIYRCFYACFFLFLHLFFSNNSNSCALTQSLYAFCVHKNGLKEESSFVPTISVNAMKLH